MLLTVRIQILLTRRFLNISLIFAMSFFIVAAFSVSLFVGSVSNRVRRHNYRGIHIAGPGWILGL
jgi:hypothetical protein